MEPLISVIVAIYNAENYLHRCLDSILAQTFTDFELLLVNDGSTDCSGKICDEYALKDSRIKVIHKSNGGVATARQCGIDNAAGEFSIHVDPDDWVEPTMLEELYKKAIEENADIVICDYFSEESNNRCKLIEQKPCNLERDSILREMLSQKLHGSCWNKLIKLSLYRDYNIIFPKDIIRWEDLYVVSHIMAVTPAKISYLNRAFYHYDQYTNNNSIVRKATMKGLKSQIKFIELFSNIIDSEEYKECFYKLKAATKELAMNSNLYNNTQVYELYSEINEEYLSRKSKSKTQTCLKLLLKKKYVLCRVILWYYRQKIKVKSLIRKIIYKIK